MNLLIMVPTGDEEGPSAVKKETHEESTDEVDAEVQVTTMTTTESLERPSCRDGSMEVETYAAAIRREDEKKQEGHDKVLRDDTQCQKMMDGATQTSTDDSFLLPPKEEKRTPYQLLQHDNSSASTTPQHHHHQQQLPTTTPLKRASRPHSSKRSPNPDHSRCNTCLPTPTQRAAAIPATATRRNIKDRKTSDEHGTANGSATRALQEMNTPSSIQQQSQSAASITTSSNVNHGQQNGCRASGSTPLSSQPQRQQDHQRQQQRYVQDYDNECGASSVTTLSLSDKPGASQIPNGPDGVHDKDDEETLVFHDGEIAAATPNGAPVLGGHTAAVSSPEDVLPMAQTLEDDALEREVLERVRSRQPVVQAESIPLPPSSSSLKGWAPWVLGLVVLISAVFVTLSGMGVLIQRDEMNRPSAMITAAPSSFKDAPIDIRPVVQWLEPFLTNRSFTIPSDSSSAQYRAIEWLSQQEQASNVTIEADLYLWVQYYVLVTLYYSTGGDIMTWNNDRLWLSTEPLCDWALITCVGSSEPTINDHGEGAFATNAGVSTATDGNADHENGYGNGTTVITNLDLRTWRVVYFLVEMSFVLLNPCFEKLLVDRTHSWEKIYGGFGIFQITII
jgi:hypothetical protein